MQSIRHIEHHNSILLCKQDRKLPNQNTKRVNFHSPASKSRQANIQSQSKPQLTEIQKQPHTNQSSNDQNQSLKYWKPCGSTRAIPEDNNSKAKVISRLSKNDSALRRHKQWLKQMQIKKEEKMKAREEEKRLKEENKRQFMAKQASRRARAREMEKELVEDDDEEEGENVMTSVDECNAAIGSSCHAQEALENRHTNAKAKANAASGEKRSRPAWSLSETGAKQVSDEREEKEEKELMDFVQDLDFESFYHDMELKVLVSQVKDRIRMLEKEKNADESRLRAVLESEVASVRNEKFNSSNDLFDAEISCAPQQEQSDLNDLRSVADTIRSEGDASVSTIHSRKSIQALVSKAKERLTSKSKSSLGMIKEDDAIGGETRMAPPVKITHTEDDGARLAETKSLNKLPFKNRNPAL